MNPTKLNRYLIGRLGGVKILILENKDRGGDGPTHELFFVDGERQGPDGGAPAQRSHQPPRRSRKPSGGPPVRPNSVPMPDDGVEDLYR